VAQRAQELASAAHATRTRGVAQTMHGMALTMVGALPDACQVLEEATAFLQADDSWLAQPWGSMGRAHVDGGDLRSGLHCIERSRALIDAAHETAEMAWIVGNLGEVLYLQGDWSQARSVYETAIQIARDAGVDRYLSYLLMHRAELCAAEGDWRQATHDIEAGVKVASHCAAVPALRKGQRLLAERDVIE
jgi:ATP/maltotriose-dependent transcriptional regulator MalT